MIKNYIVAFILSLILCKSQSQISITEELSKALQNKNTFREIKSTVIQHYHSKLENVLPSDSLIRKQIMRQLKMWNRQLWISEYYTDDKGIVQDKTKIDFSAISSIKRNFKQHEGGQRNQSGFWWQDGPVTCSNGLGRVDKIAFHPSDPQIIFAGSPFGGLFKTLNGGISWFPIGDFFSSMGVAGIAIDPTNANIIYVLTGDAHTTGPGCFPGNVCFKLGEHISSSKGVFKSYDGGLSWNELGQLSSASFRGRELVIDPIHPDVLFAATSVGLFRTDNGGESWTMELSGDVWDIELKPGDSNIVYACTSEIFYRSTDNGVNYSPVTIANLEGANRISIAVTASNAERVVLLAGPMLGITTFKGIFTSPDSGMNFSLLTQSPNIFSNTIGGAVTTDQSNYDHCIEISPIDENDIYVGGLCVWKSTDGGTNWSQISSYRQSESPYMHPDIQVLKYNPLNNVLYCGNDGGIYFYTAQLTWQLINSELAVSQFYHFELGNVSGPDWGGAQDNGIIQQTNYGNLNYQNVAAGDGYDVMTNHPWRVVNGQSNDRYFTVNSSIWKNNTSISVSGNLSFFGNLSMDPNNENHIFAGYDTGVYESNNKGSSWNIIGGIGNWCISTCRSNSNRIYTAGGTWNSTTWGAAALWRRDNTTWTNITPPAPFTPGLKITDIDVKEDDDSNIVISMGGTTPNAKVFISFNGGGNWNNITYNLPNTPIFCIKRDQSGGIYAGTSVGIFYKRVFSGYWELFSNNLPSVPVTEIEIEKIYLNGLWIEGPYIHCSTFGRGMWKSVVYGNSCDENLTLSGNHSGPRLWQANNQIISTINNTGGLSTSARYSAGNRIILKNGFRATNGTKFRTYILPCNGQIND